MEKKGENRLADVWHNLNLKDTWKLAKEIAPVAAEEQARAMQLLKMTEPEARKYKRQNEQVERELLQAKLAYDLAKNNEVRRRYEPTCSSESASTLESTRYDLLSSTRKRNNSSSSRNVKS